MEWVELLSKVGGGVIATLAAWQVWKRLTHSTDVHRKELIEEAAHWRETYFEQEGLHREAMMELIKRNADEHQETKRVLVNLVAACAQAMASIGEKIEKPYKDKH